MDSMILMGPFQLEMILAKASIIEKQVDGENSISFILHLRAVKFP